jgi:hypothetical protein
MHPCPTFTTIAYSCDEPVLNPIVIRGSQGADLSAPYSEDDEGAAGMTTCITSTRIRFRQLSSATASLLRV